MRAVSGRRLEAMLAATAHVAACGGFVRAAACPERRAANAADPSREDAPRAVRGHPADPDRAAPDPEGDARTAPGATSLSDPAAALGTERGPAASAHGTNAMVGQGSGVVLGVRAAPERFAEEPIAARRLVERPCDRHGAAPGVLTAAKARGGRLVEARIADRETEAHRRPIDRRHRTGGVVTREALTRDEARDACTRPQGAVSKRERRRRRRPARPGFPARPRGPPHDGTAARPG